MGTVLFDNLLVPMSAKRKRRYSKCQDGSGVSYSGYFNQKLSLGTVPLSHFWDALTVHDCTITVKIRTVPVDTYSKTKVTIDSGAASRRNSIDHNNDVLDFDRK